MGSKRHSLILLILIWTAFFWTCFQDQADAKAPWKDEEIASRLSAGEGGFVVRNVCYALKKGVKEKDLEKYSSYQDIIANAMERVKDLRQRSYAVCGDLYMLDPLKNKEIRVKAIPQQDFFIHVAPPGTYTVTKLIQYDFFGTWSSRLYTKIDIVAGQLKYLGDIVSLMIPQSPFKRGDLANIRDFKPEEFKAHMAQKFPLSAKFLTWDRMGNLVPAASQVTSVPVPTTVPSTTSMGEQTTGQSSAGDTRPANTTPINSSSGWVPTQR